MSNAFSSLVGGNVAVFAVRVRFFQRQGSDATAAVSSGAIVSTAEWVVKALLFLIAVPFAAGDMHAQGTSGGNKAAIWIILAVIIVAGIAATVVALVPRVRRLASARVRPYLVNIWGNVKVIVAEPHRLDVAVVSLAPLPVDRVHAREGPLVPRDLISDLVVRLLHPPDRAGPSAQGNVLKVGDRHSGFDSDLGPRLEPGGCGRLAGTRHGFARSWSSIKGADRLEADWDLAHPGQGVPPIPWPDHSKTHGPSVARAARAPAWAGRRRTPLRRRWMALGRSPSAGLANPWSEMCIESATALGLQRFTD